MENNFHKWNKTKILFLNWLAKTELKDIFSKKLRFNNLSLWWISDLATKDVVLNNEWYKELFNILNEKKYNKKNIYKFSFLKYFKKFIFTIIFTIFCKIFFPIKKDTKNFKNCFFSYERNLIKFKDLQVDRQYGFYQFRKKASCFVIFLIPNLDTIFNFKKKKNQFSSLHANYTIFNSHIAIFDIFKIYLRVFIYWFKLKLILSRKNFFYIKNKDCRHVLQTLLESSFYGKIQDELIFGLALKRIMNSNNFERFYNYLEFLQFSRSFYHFVKSSNPKIKIITINHYPYDANLLFFALNKKEFSKSNNHLRYSPKPDIFLTQGNNYARYLKKIFSFNKNIKVIGMLKNDFQLKNIKGKSIKRREIFVKNKVISIFINIIGYKNIIDRLKKVNLKNYKVILRPHPHLKNIREKIVNEFKHNLNTKIFIYDELTNRQIIKYSKFIICDDGSTAIESLLYKSKKTKVFRIISSIEPPLFSKIKEIPILESALQIEHFLNTKKNNSKINKKKIIADYIFREDVKASNRMLKLNF